MGSVNSPRRLLQWRNHGGKEERGGCGGGKKVGVKEVRRRKGDSVQGRWEEKDGEENMKKGGGGKIEERR